MKERLIAGILAGGILLIVAYTFAQGPGRPPGPPLMPDEMGMRGPMGIAGPRAMPGPMMRRMISEILDRALDRASATPEQRVKIYAARDRVFAVLDAQRPDPLAERERMLALFEADRLTTANLDTLHQQLEQQRETVRQAIHHAIVEMHDALSPPQRKIVTEYLRTHGPGPFMGMHRPGGPYGLTEPSEKSGRPMP